MNILFFNIGTQEMVVIFIFLSVALLLLAVSIMALIDLSKRELGKKSTDQMPWIALIVFAPLIGSFVYYIGFRNSYPLKKHLKPSLHSPQSGNHVESRR